MMLHDLDAIAAMFADTELEGIEPSAQPLDRSPHDRISFALTTEQIDPFEAWKIARSKLDVTGRWPVIVGPFEDGPDHGDETTGAAILERARVLDERDVFETSDNRSTEDWYQAVDDGWIEMDLQLTDQYVGAAPSLTDVREALGHSVNQVELDAWLFEWERREAAELTTADVQALTGYDRPWVDNLAHDRGRYVVALLPIAMGWQVPSLLAFFDYGVLGAREKPPENLVVALRSWHSRYGLEIWGHGYGIEMYATSARPPSSPSEALALAREIESVFGDGRWAGSTYTHRLHARELLASNQWFLMTKP